MHNHSREDGRVPRREFLGNLTQAAAAGATLPWLAAPCLAHSNPPWTMRLATSSIHFKHLPIEQACAQIAQLGFPAIDIWSAHEGCPHLDDVAERLGAEGLRKVLKKNKYKGLF